MILFKLNPLICFRDPGDGPEGVGDGVGGQSGSGNGPDAGGTDAGGSGNDLANAMAAAAEAGKDMSPSDVAGTVGDTELAESVAGIDGSDAGGNGTGLLDQLSDYAEKTIGFIGDKITGFFDVDVEGSLGLTPGQVAGDEAYDLGFGYIGQIAEEAPVDPVNPGRSLQDQRAMADTKEEKARLDDEMSYSELFGYNKTLMQNKLSTSPAIDMALALSPVPAGTRDLLGLVTAGISTAFGVGLDPGLDSPGIASIDGTGNGAEHYDEINGGDVVTNNNIVDIDDSFAVDENQEDFIGQLVRQLGVERTPVTFSVGGQQVSKVPQSQRDEMSMLLEYLLDKERVATGQDELSLRRELEEPSTIDKITQTTGVATDLLGLGKSIYGLFS